MESGNAGGGGSATVTPEAWTQITSYVQSLLADTARLKEQLTATQAHVVQAPSGPKPNKPNTFSGKLGTVDAWVSHMDQYLAGTDPGQALAIAKTYLQGEAFAWYQSYAASSAVADWPSLRDAMTHRFNPLNKEQAARNLLHKWRQIKDVTTYNKTFQSIVLDIPSITMPEKIDRYSRGLKSYIWEVLCTKQYESVETLMLDALKVEAAKRGSYRSSAQSNAYQAAVSKAESTPMDISAVQVTRLTPEERKRCMRDGLCLRCREKGHLARSCPKTRRN